MSFFKRHPKFWIAIWTVFGLGGLVMIYNSVLDQGFDIALLLRGLIGITVAGMMISYLIPAIRKTNAPNQ